MSMARKMMMMRCFYNLVYLISESLIKITVIFFHIHDSTCSFMKFIRYVLLKREIILFYISRRSDCELYCQLYK